MQEMQETGFWSLGRGDHLEEEMATTLVFLSEKSHGQRNLVDYSPRGHKEFDIAEQLSMPPCSM